MTSPIFIGGIGRSGTTLLSLMLDSHRNIKCGPELHFMGPPNLGQYILICIPHRKRKDNPPSMKPGIQFVARCERMGITPMELHREIEDITSGGNPMVSFRDRCQLIDRLANMARNKAGKPRWGIKIMAEIRHIGSYLQVWPDAQFINIYKHPYAAAWSLLKVKWGPKSARDAAIAWRMSIEESRMAVSNLENKLLELRFEDLVQDPEPAMRAVLDFLGEPWDENVLRHTEMPHTFLASPYGHPSAKQVAEPVDPAYAGQHELGALEILGVKKEVGQLMGEIYGD